MTQFAYDASPHFRDRLTLAARGDDGQQQGGDGEKS
jgi:hypothetical protein